MVKPVDFPAPSMTDWPNTAPLMAAAHMGERYTEEPKLETGDVRRSCGGSQ